MSKLQSPCTPMKCGNKSVKTSEHSYIRLSILSVNECFKAKWQEHISTKEVCQMSNLEPAFSPV